MVVSVILSAFVFPAVGQACDMYPPQVMVPISFLFRALTCLGFAYVDDPSSYWSMVVCIAMIIASLFENISIDAIFNKSLPKETRGILNGAYSFAGQLGILIFSVSAGWLFDHTGSKSPFYLVGILDFLFSLYVFIYSFFGLFNVYKAKEEKALLKSKNISPYRPSDNQRNKGGYESSLGFNDMNNKNTFSRPRISSVGVPAITTSLK